MTGLLYVLLCMVLGIGAALAAGAVSGLRIGAEALGAELAAYIGAFYGLLAGGGAVVLGLIVLHVI
jgi:hypothetical protein